MKPKNEAKPARKDLTTEELERKLMRRQAAGLGGKTIQFEKQIEPATIRDYEALCAPRLAL